MASTRYCPGSGERLTGLSNDCLDVVSGSLTGIGHKTTDLLRAPFAYQLVSDPANQAGQPFRHFPGGASALITSRLRLFRRIASLKPIALYLPANGTAVNPDSLGYLSLADASLKISKNLVSLGLGQLSVSHALLHFGRIWSPTRLQAQGAMVSRYDCTRISGL